MRDPFWLSRAEVRDLDRRAIHEIGIPSLVLMENAGRGAAELFAKVNQNSAPTRILCGPGNNGGDGFVIARHLERFGIPTEIHFFPGSPSRISPDCRINLDIASRSGIPIAVNPTTQPFEKVTWVIDALFGSGLDRPLQSPFTEVIRSLHESGKSVFAIDLPSGLHCDTGEPMGEAVRADLTVTFVGLKKGFLRPSARAWTGEIHIVGIGAPNILIDGFRRLPESE